jgi:hypothetical protein
MEMVALTCHTLGTGNGFEAVGSADHVDAGWTLISDAKQTLIYMI